MGVFIVPAFKEQPGAQRVRRLNSERHLEFEGFVVGPKELLKEALRERQFRHLNCILLHCFCGLFGFVHEVQEEGDLGSVCRTSGCNRTSISPRGKVQYTTDDAVVPSKFIRHELLRTWRQVIFTGRFWVINNTSSLVVSIPHTHGSRPPYRLYWNPEWIRHALGHLRISPSLLP